MERKHEVDNLLRIGIEMIAASGYHHTSINDVIKEAGMPKGSFYYLYKDKKSFALDALTHYNRALLETMDIFFSDQTTTSLEGVKAYFENSIQSFKKSQYCWGCLLGNMAQELSDVDEDFRTQIKKTLNSTTKKLSTQLKKAQSEGELSAHADANSLAAIIMFAWHGSLMQMKASRSKKSLTIFIDDFFNLILRNI